MATYAIGDVQGCRAELERLLVRVRFDPAVDRVWFVGDLVNRGPDSLGTLRLVRSLGDAAVTVLGNHDLHLLALALGVRRARRTDTVADVLRAPDRDELVAWLRTRPLAHREDGHLLVHAGLAPEWTAADALRLARVCEQVLAGDGASWLLPRWRDAPARRFRADASWKEIVVTTLTFLTQVRCLRGNATPDDTYSGPPDAAPRDLVAWYRFPGRRSARTTVVCGHWSALGLRIDRNLIALDTGCVWGGALTAVRIEDRAIFQIPAR